MTIAKIPGAPLPARQPKLVDERHLRFDPFSTVMLDDPFPHYHALHRSDALAWFPGSESWVAVRHAHVAEVLRSPDFVPSGLQDFMSNMARRSGRNLTHLDRVVRAVLFFDTTAEHKSRRRYFVRVLNDRPLSSFEPYLVGLVEELLGAARRNGGFDAVLDFGDVLPRRFMMRLLGVPDEDLPILQASVHNALVAFNEGCPLSEYAAVSQRLQPGIEHLEGLIRERRRAPRDDGLSRMIAMGNEEGADDSLIADRAFFLLFAGIETTATLLANSIRLLHHNPGEMERFRRGEVDLPNAVEEFLRYEAPVALTTRVATKPTTIAGVEIEAGRAINVVIQAANRDPEVFPEPDRLDLSRDASEHLAFITGGHFCIGASLARLEGRLALAGLRALPPTRLLTEDFEWWPFQTVRRVKSMPMAFV